MSVVRVYTNLALHEIKLLVMAAIGALLCALLIRPCLRILAGFLEAGHGAGQDLLRVNSVAKQIKRNIREDDSAVGLVRSAATVAATKK